MILADCNIVTKDLYKRFLLLVINGCIPLLAVIWISTEIWQRIYRSNSWNTSEHLEPEVIELSTSAFFQVPDTVMCLIIVLEPKSITTTAMVFFLLWRCDPTRVMASSFTRFLDHTQRRTTVGRLLWTSDQLVAETSTWQHTTLRIDKHPCPRWNSNPWSQQASGRRPTP